MKKVKAVLVVLTQNDRKDGDGNVVKGETCHYWYQAESYPSEVLDPGHYWDACPESVLWPATSDGVTVVGDLGTLCDWLELPDMVVVEEALALEPGQWVEREYPGRYHVGCRVRATAYAELPPLSAERTVGASDLSRKAMAMVKVNGEPLFKPMTVWGDNCVWCPGFYDFAANAIVEKVQALGGTSATVSLRSGSIMLQGERAALAFAVEARSKAALETFLRNLGVVNPEDVKVEKTVGDSAGVVRVCVALSAGNIV